MLQSIHTDTVRFRVNPALVERARRDAERKGMTLSEYLRHTLRSQLEDAA